MLTRRELLGALSAAALSAGAPAAADTLSTSSYRVPRKHRPREVRVDERLTPGAIYVSNATHSLYWIEEPGRAIRYIIAIGAEGRQFTGRAVIARKAEWPGWRPTANLIRMEPHIYGRWPDGLPGGHPQNPLGARALYLYRNGRDTIYRIHGTPQPWTMGRSFSSGCIRLVNEQVEDLYRRVPVGTPVHVA